MRIVVFLTKHCPKAIRWYWLSFVDHVCTSFLSPPFLGVPEALALGFLGAEPKRIENCLKNLRASNTALLLSIEPQGGLAPKISHPEGMQRYSICVESLEILYAFLQRLEAFECGPIILLVMHLSQIPCHDKSIHNAKFAEIINMLKRLSLSAKAVILVADEAELMSKKNSALFERLFKTDF